MRCGSFRSLELAFLAELRSLKSGDPLFPAAGTIEINVGSTTARTLSKKEKGAAEDLAAAGDGGIYWRVKGHDGNGRTVYSDVFVFELIN